MCGSCSHFHSLVYGDPLIYLAIKQCQPMRARGDERLEDRDKARRLEAPFHALSHLHIPWIIKAIKARFKVASDNQGCQCKTSCIFQWLYVFHFPSLFHRFPHALLLLFKHIAMSLTHIRTMKESRIIYDRQEGEKNEENITSKGKRKERREGLRKKIQSHKTKTFQTRDCGYEQGAMSQRAQAIQSQGRKTQFPSWGINERLGITLKACEL